jgi:hypothetical protein
MKRTGLRPPILHLVALGLLLASPAVAQKEAPAAAPRLEIEGITVEPESPAADTLCRLRVRLSNKGDQIASRLGFSRFVCVGGMLDPLRLDGGAGLCFQESPLDERADRGGGGKLRVEVTLKEAVWTQVAMETDEEGEIEVWTPIGAVENLPSSASITLQMKTGG